MPSSETQFGRQGNPMREGLGDVARPVAKRMTGVRLYEEDLPRLERLVDRSGFIRDAIHDALNAHYTALTRGTDKQS
jgi:hypothetical protein